MKGKKHSKRLATFMLALVLIATTVINPGSITSVFAENAEEAKTASEKKTEAEKKEEPTTKAKEETTTAKKEETTTKAKEEVTTAKKEETTTKAKEETTTAKKEETTTKAKEETTTTKKEETTKPEEGTTGNRSAKKIKTVGNPNAAGSSTEKDKTEEDKKEEEVKTYTVSSGTYTKGTITVNAVKKDGTAVKTTANDENAIHLEDIKADSTLTVTFKVNEAAGMKIASAKVDGKEYITNSKEDKSTVTVENVKVTENITISASFVEKTMELQENTQYSIKDRKVTFEASAYNFNQYKVNDGKWTEISDKKENPKTFGTDGKYTIQMRHYSEKVGHTYTSQKKKIVIDTEAPIIEAMKADGWVDGSYSLTIPVTDKVSGVEKISWVSGNKKGEITGSNGKFVLAADKILEGEHTYSFTAADKKGNITEKAVSVMIKKDSVKPELKVTDSAGQELKGLNGWYGKNEKISVKVKAGASGITEVTYAANGKTQTLGKTAANKEAEYTFTPMEGSYYSEIKAVSGSGVETTVAKTIQLDVTAPENGCIKYVVKDSDAENEKDKSYTVESLADLAEDDDTLSVDIEVFVQDVLSGIASIKAENLTFSSPKTVALDGKEGSYYEVTATGLTVAQAKALKVKATDIVGNVCDDVALEVISKNSKVTKLGDIVAPTFAVNMKETPVKTENDTLYYDKAVTPEFIVNEAESFKDKAGKIDYSYTVNKAGVDITDISEDGSVHTFKAPELTDGTYTITFKYTDGAGNIMKSDSEKLTGGIYMSQTIVVDTKMPIISNIDITDNCKAGCKDGDVYYMDGQGITFNFTVTDENVAPEDIEIVAKNEDGNEQVITNFTKENSKVDGKTVWNCKCTVKNGDLADGVWTFKVQIKDQVNHRKEQIVNYKYDFSLEAPEITITYNKPEKTVTKDTTDYTNETYTVQIQIGNEKEDAEGINVALDAQENGNAYAVTPEENGNIYTYTFDGKDKEECIYTFNVTCTDKHKRSLTIKEGSEAVKGFRTIVVDKKAPEISQPVLGADDKNKDINCPEKEDGKYYPNATGTKLSFSVTEKNMSLDKNGNPVADAVKVIGTRQDKTETAELLCGKNCTVSVEKNTSDTWNFTYDIKNDSFDEGDWTFTVAAKDFLDNTENKDVDGIFSFDKRKPEIIVSYDTANEKVYEGDSTHYTNAEEYKVTVKVTNYEKDANKVKVRFVNDSAVQEEVSNEFKRVDNSNTFEYTFKTSEDDEVKYEGLQIVCVNDNSISSDIEVLDTIVTDRKAPVITVNSINAGKNKSAKFDGKNHIYLKVDGKTESSSKYLIDETYLKDDSVQLVSAQAAENNIIVDKAECSTKNENTQVFSINSGYWTNVKESTDTLTLKAQDKAGNSAKIADKNKALADNSIIIDRVAPELTVTYADEAANKTDKAEKAGKSNGKELFYKNTVTPEYSIRENNYLGDTEFEESTTNNTTQDAEKAAIESKTIATYAANEWSDKNVDEPKITKEGSITYDADSHNYFTITYTDPSGNKLVLNKATYGSFDEKKALYQSPVTTVDKTTPVIEARTITGHQKATAYNKDKKTGRQYYSDDAVSIEIKVTEENFKNALFGNTIAGLGEEKATSTGFKITYSKDDRISDAIENIICSDTTDASLTEDSTKDYKWNPKGWKSDYVGGKRVWTNTVTFYTEKNYNISYDCTDLAVRKADSESDKITIDRTKPEINLVTIDTNGHKNDAEGTLNSDFVFRKGSEHASLLDFYDYVTFGYFTKGKIAVVIEAHDDVSGIQYVDVDIDGESSERHLISDTAKGNGMTHKSGNTWGTIIIKDADYKGKIKAKPTDMSGNTASKYTEPRGVISETQSQHNKAKTMKITTLTKPSNTANGINYYNRSVAVNISMGDSHSGLKSWGYTAGTAVKDNKNYGEAAGTTDKNGNPTVNNVYSMNKTVTMAAGDTNYTNKDNPTMVETEFEDNAGWTEKANEKYVIDDKKPIIKVDWTSSANVMNEKYYKATRVAHITVTERNFNEAGVDWQINNETGVVKSGWSHNGDTHTCDVSFTKDGDFILNFKITDYAMNSDSYKGEEFTIDKTAPVISISFDRNNPSNGYYFNTPRTATLHIEEHNFAAKDVTYELSGSNDGKGIGSPTAGGWSTGSDHHTASIYYGSDGEFSLNFNYTDMAGNPANKIQTEKFVIDLTKPVCKITNVEDHAAYNGKVAPGIEYSDTNLDENQVTVKLVGNKVGNASYEKNAPVSIHNGRTVQWKDFARKEKVDDIYTMELTIKDKAGNESTDKKVFSVNRFGSNYIFGTDTQALLDKIYSNQEIPVEVREINVNSLKEKAISVKNEDNEITELQAGSDYTVTEGNDKYKWKEYRYVINGDVFAQESEYNVTLSSKDAAANEMNNVAKNKDIDFIIDKTNPTGIVSGLEESSYKEDSHKINVRAMDNYQLDEAVLYVDGSEYKTFASEDFQGDKGVEVTLDSKNKPQEIYLSLTDKAGNSVDLKKTQCLITSNAWIQYINNKPLFYSTVGGGAALIIAILGIATRGFGYASSMAAQSGFWWTILGKRREDEDED